MTAALQDILTIKVGPEDQVLPNLYQFQVAAATTIYGGTMVCVNASGYAVPASATAGLSAVIGRCERQVVNTTAAGVGTNGALQVLVDRGAFWFNLNADSTVTIASWGTQVYASDDNTVSTNDGGGTRPFAGWLVPAPTTPGVPGTLSTAAAGTKVAVQLPFTPVATAASPASSAFYARGVALTAHAYSGTGTGVLTSTATGTFASQFSVDGITIKVNDTIFIPAGLTNVTAVDSGPWVVTTLGIVGTATVLTRPDWFSHGALLVSGQTVKIGGEGQIYQNTNWRSTAATGTVVDTTDCAFYVEELTFQVTLVDGTEALAAAQPSPFANYPLTGSSAGAHSFPAGIYSASQSNILVSMAVGGGTQTTTVGFGPAIHTSTSIATPGYVGTAAASVWALAAGQTLQNGDTSTLNVTLKNFA